MSTLDDLITRANNVLGALEGLIEGDAAETPLIDTSVSYTLPATSYDETNSAWILTQTTADTVDGLYKGLFTLALETGCAYLTVVSHNVVTPDDNVPARYLACGGSTLTDVAAMTTLNDKQIEKLEIRSKQPFSVSIRLAINWCYHFDFSATDGGFAHTPDTGGGVTTLGVYSSGVGHVSNNQSYNNNFQRTTENRFDRTFSSPVTIKNVRMTYDQTFGTAVGGTLTRVDIVFYDGPNLVTNQPVAYPSGNGTNQVYERNFPSGLTFTRIYVVINSCYWDSNHGAFGQYGSSVVHTLELSGDGNNPLGIDNCT